MESGEGNQSLNTYVMHFLIEAKAAGFAPPVDMFQAGLRHLQKMAGETPHDVEGERNVVYAIYLLTREGVITTNYILNLRDHLGGDEEAAWRRDLTGVYLAGAYSLLKEDGPAEELIGAYRMGKRRRFRISTRNWGWIRSTWRWWLAIFRNEWRRFRRLISRRLPIPSGVEISARFRRLTRCWP